MPESRKHRHPGQQLPMTEPAVSHRPPDEVVRVVRCEELSSQTGQSHGVERLTGVQPGGQASSAALWFGRVANAPGTRSVPHHHGEAETGGYVVSGHARISWGGEFQHHVDMESGDFCYVPAHLVHIEANLSDTEPLVFLTCRTPDNIVVNLPDVEYERTERCD